MQVKITKIINTKIEISTRHLAEHLFNFGFDIGRKSKFQFKEHAGIVSLVEIDGDDYEHVVLATTHYSWKGFLRKLMMIEGILREKEPNKIQSIEFKTDKLKIEII